MRDYAIVLGPVAAVWLIAVAGIAALGSWGAVMRVDTRFQKWLLSVPGTVFIGFGLIFAIDR